MNFRLKKLFTAEVAQLAEHLVVAQVVEGSSPFFRPRFTPNIVRGFLFFRFSILSPKNCLFSFRGQIKGKPYGAMVGSVNGIFNPSVRNERFQFF